MHLKFSKIFLVSVCLACVLFIINLKSAAYGIGSDGEFVVSVENGNYAVSSYGEGGLSDTVFYNSLNEFFGGISGGRIYFKEVLIEDNITLVGGNFVFSGEITLGALSSIDVKGASIKLDKMKMNSFGGKIRIKSGSLTVSDSEIEIESKTLFVLDHSSSACLEILSGKISSRSEDAIIDNSRSTLRISGGELLGNVNNSASFILSGEPIIKGKIYSDTPVWLSDGVTEFSGKADIYTDKSFDKGNIICLFYSASESSLSGIRVYDVLLNEQEPVFFSEYEGIDEKDFGAVYMPFSVEYFVNGQAVLRESVLYGERASAPALQEKTGYQFEYWREEGGKVFDFNAEISKDLKLNAVYSLSAPTFSINSLSFTYDGLSRKLELKGVSHPLLDGGRLVYLWYKDGVAFSSLESIEIKNVSDSASYSCELSFIYDKDSVSVRTPAVSVSVKKATVELTELTPLEYTGKMLFPTETDTELYTVECEGGIDVGIYEARITLTDYENYSFSHSTESCVYLDFEITKAINSWSEELKIENIYVGASLAPSAKGTFGKAEYLYCDTPDGEYSEKAPTKAGKYYVIARIPETKNYFPLESQAVPFEIYGERVVSIAVNTPPKLKDYAAFESFNPEGLSVLVLYDSGKREIIDGELCEIFYNDGESLKYGDTSVRVSFMGKDALVSLNVEKAEYQFESFEFSDYVTEYMGERVSIFYSGKLPVGLDGSTPIVNVIGGGINVGSYTVILEFTVDSSNYMTPPRRVATLTVLPREVELVIGDTEFIYDAGPKVPSAYYIDIFGKKVYPEMYGEKSLVGTYSAVAVSDDSNYKILNSKIDFEIKKADYDMSGVCFSESRFVYDGTEKSVEIISGLPSGVSVIGYSNNTATDAGKYYADFSFNYDSRNYNPPSLAKYEWEILRAEYIIPKNTFSDNSAVYDGNLHYPSVNFDMPVGKDGISLTYKFSKGALNVSEGKCAVEISFFTESKNYSVPESIVRYVEIIPRDIEVEWLGESFVYNEQRQAPSARCEEFEAVVLGAAIDAGSYVASAVSPDSNYRIINSEYSFTIKKAENLWLTLPAVSDVFVGTKPSPSAAALAGDVIFRFYADEKLTEETWDVSNAGVYYMQAYTDGDKNHEPLFADPIRFRVKAIIPIALSVKIKDVTFTAFDEIPNGFIEAILLNNDSSKTPVDPSKLKVEYLNGDSLRYGDGYVNIFFGEFSAAASVSVKKADYDMSGVYWQNTDFTYDGAVHQSTVSGLPEGVSVIEYVGGLGVDAGEYPVSALLLYDEQNYNKPVCPKGTLVIKRATVDLSDIESLIYNGKKQLPNIPGSPLYSVSISEGRQVGKYPVLFKIKDTRNYSFHGHNELTLYYEILPVEIEIKIYDVHTYIFERDFEFGYEIVSGSLVDGDELDIAFEVADGKIFASSKTDCYRLVYSPAELTEHSAFSVKGQEILFISTLIFCTLVLFGIVIYCSRYRIKRAVLGIKYKFKPIIILPEEAITEAPRLEKKTEQGKEGEISIPVNAVQADGLISDSLAKSLVKKDDTVIYTKGNRRGIINVDTLSENFSSGERVDINDLKAKSLIPYDTGYIKVLARGVIDKSLKVYANDFSLAAIKMIALTGGEALRSVTRSEKSEKKNDKST